MFQHQFMAVEKGRNKDRFKYVPYSFDSLLSYLNFRTKHNTLLREISDPKSIYEVERDA